MAAFDPAAALRARGYATDTPAGLKGAVMAFQRAAGLTADGVAGKKTIAALKAPIPAAAVAVVSSGAVAATVAALTVSPIGRAAIEGREANRLTAYRDSKGILTISVGITTASGLITVTPGLRITAAQSDALFARAIEKYAAPVRAALSRPVPQPFFDACVSLAYNIGPVGFAHSTIVRRANAGDLKGAIAAFLAWNKPTEIIARRQGEHDQAALSTYDGARVYARRGDRSSVTAAA